MANPLVSKLAQWDRLSDDEREVLETAITQVRRYAPGQDVVREGDLPGESKLLLEGMCCRYVAFADGRRQISALHVPGDFVDLHSLLIKPMDHGVAAINDCAFAAVPHEFLRRITETHPHLTRLLWLSTLIDGAILRQWLTAAGRRSATGQAAHLFCELYLRLKTVGLTQGNSFSFPLTQTQLGDALGLSLVHVNRVAQELRREGLITWRSGTVTIDDWDRLSDIAEFDATYLNLRQEPR